MFDTTPPPHGSTIERTYEGSDVRLTLREATMHPVRKFYIGIALFFLLPMPVMTALIFLLTDVPNAGKPTLEFVAVMIGWETLFLLPLFGPLLLRRRPESVTFADESLTHDSGSPSLPPLAAFFFGPMSLHLSGFLGTDARPITWKRRVQTLSREALSNVQLDRVGERQRLTIDHGADRIEIGISLREPEREWLADVLQRWYSRD